MAKAWGSKAPKLVGNFIRHDASSRRHGDRREQRTWIYTGLGLGYGDLRHGAKTHS